MGSCIICGSSIDGRVCEIHEEDVVFEFRGTAPNELTADRYYRGTVDGYADFGIFVDIGDSVTGLLHKSELDKRLDSIDLEPGDTVYVQVQNVRDNGDVDLGWSIRQDRSRFRGALVDDPDGEEKLLGEEDDSAEADSGPVRKTPEESTASSGSTDRGQQSSSTESTSSETAESEQESEDDEAETAETDSEVFVEATVSELADNVGARVRIEGEVESVRQTSGPTVFELRDETGTVECAAFEEAGVRAYPEVETSDIVRIEGEVEKRRGEIQVETEGLVVLEDEQREAVTERMREAMVQRARPGDFVALAADEAPEAVAEPIRDAATAIRRAVIEGRPIVVRHAATADGYVAASAVERAALPLIREEHQSADAEYHYFDRRPLEGSVYDMDDATKDVTTMLSNRSRHDETIPLFVFVAAGGTEESIDGFDLLDTYDARRVVIDEQAIDAGVEDAVDVLVSPTLAGDFETTATVLGANVAAHVNGDVRTDLAHLPAISFWEDSPEQYAELAVDAGYDEEDARELREAIALEAFYQSYEDKRELISDLLFTESTDDPVGLAGHISEQFRTQIDAEVDTAEANLEHFETDDEPILVLDTEAYTHRYEFPPEWLLLDELYRRRRDECVALVGVAEDEAFIRTDSAVDVRGVVEVAREHAPESALSVRSAREGRVEFLIGERESARDALLEALSEELSSVATA